MSFETTEIKMATKSAIRSTLASSNSLAPQLVGFVRLQEAFLVGTLVIIAVSIFLSMLKLFTIIFPDIDVPMRNLFISTVTVNAGRRDCEPSRIAV